MSRKVNIPTKKFLKREYIENGLSAWEIEKRFGYSRWTVYRKLKDLKGVEENIKQRNIIYGNINM